MFIAVWMLHRLPTEMNGKVIQMKCARDFCRPEPSFCVCLIRRNKYRIIISEGMRVSRRYRTAGGLAGCGIYCFPWGGYASSTHPYICFHFLICYAVLRLSIVLRRSPWRPCSKTPAVNHSPLFAGYGTNRDEGRLHVVLRWGAACQQVNKRVCLSGRLRSCLLTLDSDGGRFRPLLSR